MLVVQYSNAPEIMHPNNRRTNSKMDTVDGNGLCGSNCIECRSSAICTSFLRICKIHEQTIDNERNERREMWGSNKHKRETSECSVNESDCSESEDKNARESKCTVGI